MNLKITGIAAKWLFAICLPVLLLTVSLGWTVNSRWLYQYGFNKYDAGQTTGLSQPELNQVSSELRSYFNSGEEYISLTVIKDGKPFALFNQREIDHLKDVKGLIRLDYWLIMGISKNHPTYINNQVFDTTVWYYFIENFLTRNPLPFLILILISTIIFFKQKDKYNELFLIIPSLIILLYFSFFHVQEPDQIL